MSLEIHGNLHMVVAIDGDKTGIFESCIYSIEEIGGLMDRGEFYGSYTFQIPPHCVKRLSDIGLEVYPRGPFTNKCDWCGCHHSIYHLSDAALRHMLIHPAPGVVVVDMYDQEFDTVENYTEYIRVQMKGLG